MPRHFLVKRHTPVDAAMCYPEQNSTHQRPNSQPDPPREVRFAPRIVAQTINVPCEADSDQHTIITEDHSRNHKHHQSYNNNLYHQHQHQHQHHHHGHHLHQHHLGEYASHGSPDSGYAASPNSTTHSQQREKDSVAFKKEHHNNNNNNDYTTHDYRDKTNSSSSSSSSSIGSYKNDVANGHYVTSIDMFQVYSKSSYNPSESYGDRNSYGNAHYLPYLGRHHAMHDGKEETVHEAPIDLSMPSKRRNSSPSQPCPNEQNNLHGQPSSSPATKESVATTAEAAAIMYLNHLRGRGFQLSQSPPHPAYPQQLTILPWQHCGQTCEDSSSSPAINESTLPSVSGHDYVPCISVPVVPLSKVSPLSLSAPSASVAQQPRSAFSPREHSIFHSATVPTSVFVSVTSPPIELSHINRLNSTAQAIAHTSTETFVAKNDENLKTNSNETCDRRISTPPSSSSPTASGDLPKSAPQMRNHLASVNVESSPVSSTSNRSPTYQNNRVKNKNNSNTVDPSSTTAATPRPKSSTSTSSILTQGTKLATAPAAGKRANSGTMATSASGRRLKAVRKLDFDVDTTSPVSGTIIKDAADFHPEEGRVVYGDIEPSFNLVEVTPEARAELEKIENKIGDYICQLCKEVYEDAFQLAQHRCSRIVHVEYRCPECEKVFNCPANLASHRRWHKPRVTNGSQATKTSSKTQKITSKQRVKGGRHMPGKLVIPAAVEVMAQHKTASVNERSSPTYNSENTTPQQGDHKGDQTARSGIRNSEQLNGHDEINESSQLSLKTDLPLSHECSIKEVSSFQQSSDNSDQPLRTSLSANALPLTEAKVINHNSSGSSLTAEERSLVLQVLSSHNNQIHQHHQQQQQQQQHTTTTMSTSTIMTPIVSGDFSVHKNGSEALYGGKKLKLEEYYPAEIIHSAQIKSEEDAPIDMSKKSSYKYDYATDHHSQTINHGHATLIERPSNPQWRCQLCGKKFLRQAYLKKHIQNQHKNHQSSSSAPVAHFTDTIITNQSENHHIFRKNPLKRPLTTTTKKCRRLLASDDVERVDLYPGIDSLAKAVNDLSYACRMCGKCFSTEPAQLKHEMSAHGVPSSHICGTCDSSFSSKTALEKHTRTVHAAEHFACKYCASTFHSSPGLTRHINKCHPTENRQVILLQLPTSRPC
ncbi:insulinoma-associated protein [Plakobranchus ocellatus]|uniref:Insulinoma-associated protein n=1 Tax=Plakobranchus ocellatus TaxID=259542 RepID=A0AAV4CRL0_9GAST|nr:insulinoma-associated protein [Plakobranchus ocellatus]